MTVLRRSREYVTDGWAEMSRTLTLSRRGCRPHPDRHHLPGGVAANVAEAHDVPLGALHYFPCRMNTQVLPVRLPGPVLRTGWSVAEWGHWKVLKAAEDDQRRALKLPPAKVRAIRRIVEGGAIELQAYDELFFPGLSEEWRGIRQLVGFAFTRTPDFRRRRTRRLDGGRHPRPSTSGSGSMPVESPRSAIAMISSGVRRPRRTSLDQHGRVGTSTNYPCTTTSNSLARGESLQGLPGVPRSRPPRRCGDGRRQRAGGRSRRWCLWVSADQPVWGRRRSTG